MSRIARLPEIVANQIAAGEVVERPASVVKELLENAVDAGAVRIEVAIEGGGVDLIRVTDDGTGMSPDDALLCLERHATSKIKTAQDITTVATLGFRGEAIPSIASVSRFTLTTRPAEDTEGTRIIVVGGKVTDRSAYGAAPGTTIEVRDLFFNVPARKKFLKRAATEMSHISDAVERVALANPHIAIKLTNDGRTSVDVPKASGTDPKGRLARILGKRLAEHVHPLPAPEDDRAVKVRGWFAAPELTERTSKGLHCFVNGRYVRDRTIQHAVVDAYRTLMERGRYPVVVLWIDVLPELVDVNVHPQKTEVRFAETGSIHSAITRALGAALGAQPWLHDLGFAPTGANRAPPPTAGRRYVLDHAGGATANRRELSGGGSGLSGGGSGLSGGGSMPDAAGAGLSEHRARVAAAAAALGRGGSGWRENNATAGADLWSVVKDAPAGGVGDGRFSGLRPVGQIMTTYLVCEGPGRMVVIDQHAAHERVAFERMRRQRRDGKIDVQPLLVPRTIELAPAQAAVATEQSTRLAAVGFELEAFGDRTWLLKAVPAALGKVDVEALLRDVLDELAQVEQSTPLDEAVDAMLSCAACHTVVRAGDRLGRDEIAALLSQMDQIDFGAHCPHGRPVFVEWTEQDLAKLFHRT